MEHTIVYTTAYVFEVDIVRDAFKKEDLPFYIQSENLAGVRVAFEASPAAGLGRRWHFFIPVDTEVKARRILATLHVSSESDSKPFFTASRATFTKGLWKALLLVSPVIAILGYVIYRGLTNR